MGNKEISNEDIAHYLAIRAQKKATKAAKKVNSNLVLVSSGYDNDSNPFCDSNLSQKFVWQKKIEHDVSRGALVHLDMFSKKRQREIVEEIETVKRRREQKAAEKAQHEEDMAILARQRAQAEFLEWEKREQDFLLKQNKLRSEIRLREGRPLSESESEDNYLKMRSMSMKTMGPTNEGDDVFGCNTGEQVNMDLEVQYCDDKYRLRKPKYLNRVHTGYHWNKYNQVHYDHDKPPPKFVQGYKFNIFYPDLLDKTRAPTYSIEKDDSDDGTNQTCIIRFHAGPPYEDIAFRIVSDDWEYSRKKGFTCTYEHDTLRLYFSIKHYRYRR